MFRLHLVRKHKFNENIFIMEVSQVSYSYGAREASC